MKAECEIREEGCETQPFAQCPDCGRTVCASCATDTLRGLVCWPCWDDRVRSAQNWVRQLTRAYHAERRE